MAQSILIAFSPRGAAHDAGIFLDAVEIGNEADLYAPKGKRPSSYNISSSVAEYVHSSSLMAPMPADNEDQDGRVLLSKSSIKQTSTLSSLHVYCSQASPVRTRIAEGSAHNVFSKPAFFGVSTVNMLIREYIVLPDYLQPLNLILLVNTINFFTSRFSQHHYSSSVCSDVHGPAAQILTFMDKRTIRGNISIFDADIQAVKSQGLNYIFGETNSISCHGAPGGSCFKSLRSKWTQRVLTHVPFSMFRNNTGVSNSAAAAIWMIDYSLQAAVKGVNQMFFHMGVGFKYNLVSFISCVTDYAHIHHGTLLSVPSQDPTCAS